MEPIHDGTYAFASKTSRSPLFQLLIAVLDDGARKKKKKKKSRKQTANIDDNDDLEEALRHQPENFENLPDSPDLNAIAIPAKQGPLAAWHDITIDNCMQLWLSPTTRPTICLALRAPHRRRLPCTTPSQLIPRAIRLP